MAVSNFGSGGTHRALTGLTADDHPQYAKYDSGPAANRPAASASLNRTFYYADDQDRLYACVDTTGAGGWAWVLVPSSGPSGILLPTGLGGTGQIQHALDATRSYLLFGAMDGAGKLGSSIVLYAPDDPNGEGGKVSIESTRPSDGVRVSTLVLLGEQLLAGAVGSATAPAYSFSADRDTGIYRPAAGQVGIAVDGTYLARFQSGTYPGLVINTGQMFAAGGTAANPGFAFAVDTDTGMYRPSENNLHLVTVGVSRLILGSTGIVAPGADGTQSLGYSAGRWKDVWAANATIQTSDETLKSSVEETPLGLDFVRALHPIRFRFTDGTRPHDGFGAQQVREALTALGIADAAAYIDPTYEAEARENPYAAKKPTAEFVADFLPEEPEDSDADAKKEHKRAVKEAKNRAQEEWDQAREAFDAETEAMRAAPKGLRYSELIAPLYRAVQEQQDQIEELRAENESLQSTVSDLVARLEALEAR